jgi:hypothetical protein
MPCHAALCIMLETRRYDIQRYALDLLFCCSALETNSIRNKTHTPRQKNRTFSTILPSMSLSFMFVIMKPSSASLHPVIKTLQPQFHLPFHVISCYLLVFQLLSLSSSHCVRSKEISMSSAMPYAAKRNLDHRFRRHPRATPIVLVSCRSCVRVKDWAP